MFIYNKYTKHYFRLVDKCQSRVKPDGYTERHHIIPRCLGGSDDPDNIVVLTAREHFICHRLLTRMVEGRAKFQMEHALYCLMVCRRHDTGELCVTARLFEQIRVAANTSRSILLTGIKRSDETKERCRQAALKRERKPTGPHSEERRQKIAQTLKGRPPSPETCLKISQANRGQKRTEEAKQRISAALKGRKVIITDETKVKISRALKGRPSPMRGREPWTKGKSHSEASKKKMSDSHANRTMILCLCCGKTVQKATFARWHGDRCATAPIKDWVPPVFINRVP